MNYLKKLFKKKKVTNFFFTIFYIFHKNVVGTRFAAQAQGVLDLGLVRLVQ